MLTRFEIAISAQVRNPYLLLLPEWAEGVVGGAVGGVVGGAVGGVVDLPRHGVWCWWACS